MMWKERYAKEAGVADFVKNRRTRKFTDDLFNAIDQADEDQNQREFEDIAKHHREMQDVHFNAAMADMDESNATENTPELDASAEHRIAANAIDSHLLARKMLQENPSDSAYQLFHKTRDVATELSERALDRSISMGYTDE